MGLSPAEFAALTPFFFNAKCAGYARKLDEEEEPYRMLGWITFAMAADPKEVKRRTVNDIWPKRSELKKKKQTRKTMKFDVAAILKPYRDKLKPEENG